MKFDKKCIKCDSASNLNTVLAVKVDGKNVRVVICDEHADDTTPKQAKEIVKSKMERYNELVKEMKDYGIDVNKLSETKGGIIVAEKPEPEPEPEPEVEDVPEKPRSRVLKKARIGKVKSIGGTAQGVAASVNVESRQSIDAEQAVMSEVAEAKRKGERVTVPVTEDVEFQTVSGRQGQPMNIPRKIKHNDGNTQIAVVDTGGDRTIQNRFKALAEDSKNRDSSHHFGKQGYDVQECTLCRGTGIARIGGGPCKKCKGMGFLNKGW